MTRPSAGAFMPTLRPVKSTRPHMRRRVWGDGDRASAAPPANPPPQDTGAQPNAPIFSGKRAGGGGQTGSGDIQKGGFAIFALNYAEYKTKFALFCAVIFKKPLIFTRISAILKQAPVMEEKPRPLPDAHFPKKNFAKQGGPADV